MSIIKQDYGELSGGQLVETEIFSSSASSISAGNQTLNDNINNYKYLKLVFDCGTMIIGVDDFVTSTSSNSFMTRGGTYSRSGGNYFFARKMYYVDTNKIYFDTARVVGNTLTDATCVLIRNIYGLK